jgi:hypothetical protein
MRRHFGGRKVPPHSRFVVLFGARGRSFPESLCQKERFLAEVVLAPLRAASGIFKDQGAAIAIRDFLGLPIWALVEAPGLCAGGIPFLVEPVQVRFVIGYPFLDGLPGWLDRLQGFDIEGRRWRAGKLDETLPEAMEAEEEFDFLTPDESADGFHGALAAGALERGCSPKL